MYLSDDGVFSIQTGVFDDKGVGRVQYDDRLKEIGYATMELFTNQDFSDNNQFYAAGYLEGYLVQEKIWNHRNNTITWYLYHYLDKASQFDPKTFSFLSDNMNWIQGMVQSQSENNDYWLLMGGFLSQYQGLLDGYNKAAPSDQQMTAFEMWVYVALGEILDIQEAVQDQGTKRWYHTDDPSVFTDQWTLRNRCSGLIKLTPDFSELFVSQVTWESYATLNRVMKSYNFQLHNEHIVSQRMSFSSYPGFLFSCDDMYVLSSKLVAIETTYSMFNESLFLRVKAESVLDWMRVMAANFLADNAKTWADAFSIFNSGTYNNQWIIVDYNKFEPGNPQLQDGLVWMAEQIPGEVESHDVTDMLRNDSYIPSFNVPHFKHILDICNYTETLKAQGPHGQFWTDPEKCCRANIFRRDHVKVKDMDTMKALMRYNDWKNDPLSIDPVYGPDAGAGISSRYDLRSKDYPRAMAFGALDAKIVSNQLIDSLTGQWWLVAGPTHDDQPVFSFSTCEYWAPNMGLPDVYDFDWALYDAKWR